jgi:biopolymer transport protein ExbB/TolQ
MGFLAKFVNEGGFTSYLIVISACFLFILSLDRIRYLFFKVKPAGAKPLSELSQKVLVRDYKGALQMCNSVDDVPQLQVIKSGLLAVESGREAMKSALGATVVEITKDCEKRVPLIALIASIATLLGLLGTISGMIRTFEAIAVADPATKAEKLGMGIAEAMTATAAGLIVGVIAMIIHTICTVKIDEITSAAQKSGFNIITLIEKSERGT